MEMKMTYNTLFGIAMLLEWAALMCGLIAFYWKFKITGAFI
jgi:hypothetical protein